MHEGEARKYRGVGSVGVKWLIEAGYVYKDGYGNLSVRVKNVLAGFGILTKEQAIEAINNGSLNPNAKTRGWNSPARNYGMGSHKEVCEWAGVEFKWPVKPVKLCPHCGKPV